MNRIVFLGCGGGGFIMIKQVLATGGIYIELDGKKILLDPGPGCLVRAKQFKVDLTKLDLILLSHFHPDHATDVNVVIEAMTLRTKKKRGTLIAEKSCLHGKSRVVDEYHQNALARVITAKPDQTFDFDKLRIKVTRSKHYDPTVGFHIEGSVSIGYPADGPYFAGQSKPFTGCDVLILNALMPAGVEETIHLSTDGAAKLAKKVGPKLAVLQHFGFTVLRAGLNAQRDFVERRSGVKTVVARDGMLINLDELKPETGIKKFFMKK